MDYKKELESCVELETERYPNQNIERQRNRVLLDIAEKLATLVAELTLDHTLKTVTLTPYTYVEPVNPDNYEQTEYIATGHTDKM